MEDNNVVFRQAGLRTYKIDPKLWMYICDRLGLPSKVLKGFIGSRQNREDKFPRASILALDYFCQLRIGESLEALAAQVAELVSHKELARMLGCSPLTAKTAIANLRDVLLPLPNSQWIYKTDLPVLFGMRELSEHLKRNPLWIWRQESNLSITQAAIRSGLKENGRYMDYEAGLRLPNVSSRRRLSKCCPVRKYGSIKRWYDKFVRLLKTTQGV